MRLKDQVAVITGAGRGIGRAIAIRCGQEGAKVVLAARTKSQLKRTAEEIGDNDGHSLVVPTDVTTESEVRRLMEQALSEFERIDLMVNAAGRLTAIGPTWQTDSADWWADVCVNVGGVYLCSRIALDAMMQAGGGRIVNIVGGGTSGPFPYGSAYGTSKAAVMRFTETMAKELQEQDAPVKAFALDPGLVRTAMTEQFEQTEAGRKYMARIIERLREGKDVPPDRAAEMVVAIACGELDDLQGRFLSAEDDLDRLNTLRDRSDEIVERDERILHIES